MSYCSRVQNVQIPTSLPYKELVNEVDKRVAKLACRLFPYTSEENQSNVPPELAPIIEGEYVDGKDVDEIKNDFNEYYQLYGSEIRIGCNSEYDNNVSEFVDLLEQEFLPLLSGKYGIGTIVYDDSRQGVEGHSYAFLKDGSFTTFKQLLEEKYPVEA